MASAAVFEHSLGCFAQQQMRGEEIDVEDFTQFGYRRAVRSAVQAMTSVGKYCPWWSEGLFGGIKEFVCMIAYCHIDLNGDAAIELCADIVQWLDSAPGKHDGHTSLPAGQRRCSANAGAAPRDDDRPPLELYAPRHRQVCSTPVRYSPSIGKVEAICRAAASSSRVRCGSMMRSTHSRAAP